MSCSRCGQNRVSRPVPPPSIVTGRPGSVYHAPRPTAPTPQPTTYGGGGVRGAITGLRYVPGK